MTTNLNSPLNAAWSRGCAFLGSPTAIMGGAMTWVSESKLVSSISNAGGFGVLASGAMPPDMLGDYIRQTRALTAKPFGVNLIVMHPQLTEMVDVCIAENTSHVVFAGGQAPMAEVKKLQAAGCKVIAFAPALSLAKRLVKQGIDALIIEGMEAGGHIGAVSTSVLAQEILPHITQVPVFVAGGIGRGEAIATYLQQGASGVQLGTRFAAAAESIAHDKFKQAFIKANARDAVTAPQLDQRFPVIPVRALHNQGQQEFLEAQAATISRVDSGELNLKEGQLAIEHYWAGALRRAVVDGDVEKGSLMAGQSVGMVKSVQPLADIIAELCQQAETALGAPTYPVLQKAL